MKNIKPKDIIAIILILAFISFKLTGHNGSLDTAMALLLGYYFVKRIEHKDDGK